MLQRSLVHQVVLLLRVLLRLLCTGYEAETVAAADRSLKDAIGPLAYVVAGATSTDDGGARGGQAWGWPSRAQCTPMTSL
jgi:hypothetical protein